MKQRSTEASVREMGENVANGRGADEAGPRDAVRRLVEQWSSVDPSLDLSPVEVVARINRLATLFAAADQHLLGTGLARGEFDLLGALRRVGTEMTPSDLARETSSSGAAVTKRLKLLLERGLVARRPDDRDRRVAWVSLTPEGAELHARYFETQLAVDRDLLGELDLAELERVATLLGRLLASIEGRFGGVR